MYFIETVWYFVVIIFTCDPAVVVYGVFWGESPVDDLVGDAAPADLLGVPSGNCLGLDSRDDESAADVSGWFPAVPPGVVVFSCATCWRSCRSISS